MTGNDRLAGLRQARERVTLALNNPGTPAYSLAPLSNQLRLVDREIERLTRPDVCDDGLPTSPEKAGWLDFMQFRAFVRRGSERQPPTTWAVRQRAIFETWLAAGFRVPDRFDGEDSAAWGERCRIDLTRCLSPQGAAL